MISPTQILTHIFLMEVVFLMGWTATIDLPVKDRLLIILGGEALYLTFFVVAKWHRHAEVHDGA
jgi:hypothetical protein